MVIFGFKTQTFKTQCQTHVISVIFSEEILEIIVHNYKRFKFFQNSYFILSWRITFVFKTNDSKVLEYVFKYVTFYYALTRIIFENV